MPYRNINTSRHKKKKQLTNKFKRLEKQHGFRLTAINYVKTNINFSSTTSISRLERFFTAVNYF